MAVKLRDGQVVEIVQNYSEYRNQPMVDQADSIVDAILAEKNSNKHRDHFFPKVIDAMGFKTGVEIGVDKAEFSNHLLTRSKLEKLYCVDPWPDDFGSNHRKGAYDKNGNNRMQEAFKNVGQYIENGRAVMIRNVSHEAALNIPDGSLDFCYIDGDHTLEGVYVDIYTWIHKLRLGGIMAGHDYKDGPGSGMMNYWGEQLPYRVKTVVDNYCDQYGFKIHAVGGRKNLKSWWFVKTI